MVLGPDGVAHFAGLQVCGLVWACPVCSAAIRERRGEEINQVGRAHLAAGGGLEFATFTARHYATDRLAGLLRLVSKAWTTVTRSRGYRGLLAQFGPIGYVRAVEITHGYHGWHPHLHVLLFTERRLTAAERAQLIAVLEVAWGAAIAKLGGRPVVDGIGVKVVKAGAGVEGLARYLTKVQDGFEKARGMGIAREMTRGDVKKGRRGSRTPFELLDQAVHGDRDARALWHEYEQATAGKKCLTWSNGLKARYAVDEVDDQAAATDAAADEARTVIVLTDEQWSLIETSGWATQLLDRVEKLGGGFDVAEWIRPLYRRLDFEEQLALSRLKRLTA